MNGNPNMAQRRYHAALREMYFYTEIHRGSGELHHIFGSKEKFKLLKEAGIEKAGEWFVLMIPRSVHLEINRYDFDEERSWFFQQKENYQKYFGEECPVPDLCYQYYAKLTTKHVGLKRWQ